MQSVRDLTSNKAAQSSLAHIEPRHRPRKPAVHLISPPQGILARQIFAGKPALHRGKSVRCNEGEVVGLVGQGKPASPTLLKIISRKPASPTQVRSRARGREVELPELPATRIDAGDSHIYQDLALVPTHVRLRECPSVRMKRRFQSVQRYRQSSAMQAQRGGGVKRFPARPASTSRSKIAGALISRPVRSSRSSRRSPWLRCLELRRPSCCSTSRPRR